MSDASAVPIVRTVASAAAPCGKCVRGGILVRAVEFIQQGECDLWLIWHPYSRDMGWLPLERPAARPKGPASQ